MKNFQNGDIVTCFLKPLDNSSITEELDQSYSASVDAVGIEIIFVSILTPWSSYVLTTFYTIPYLLYFSVILILNNENS